MPRFSAKELLVGITLFAIGIALLSVLVTTTTDKGPFLILFLFFGSGTLIGAGLFTPFKHPWIGALVGFVIMLILFAWLMTLVQKVVNDS